MPLDYDHPDTARLREDLALALRAAAHHGLSEGVCNHFSVALPDDSRRFLINPRGLHWSEVGADDIVLIDEQGQVLAGRHRVEPTAMFIHGAVHRITGHAVVLHTHMPYATALTLTTDRALDPCASQGAMRFFGRIGIDADYNGLALDWAEGERIARAMQGKDVAFLGNHGVVVTGATRGACLRRPVLPGARLPAPGAGDEHRAPAGAGECEAVGACGRADPGRARAVGPVLRGAAADVAGTGVKASRSTRQRFVGRQAHPRTAQRSAPP